MTAKREYLDYLKDILDAAAKAAQFVEGMSFAEFQASAKTRFAVDRALGIIGEAAKNIPDPVREKYPGVPWRDLSGLRDRIIHAYFQVDLRRVWEIVRRDLPALQEAVARVLEEEIRRRGDRI